MGVFPREEGIQPLLKKKYAPFVENIALKEQRISYFHKAILNTSKLPKMILNLIRDFFTRVTLDY